MIARLIVGPLEANCYIVSNEENKECVIIDPGMDATQKVRDFVSGEHLTPVSLLATHGHIDHIACAQELADDYAIPLRIHSKDRHLLSDLGAGLTPDLASWFQAFFPEQPREPALVEVLDGWTSIPLAGLDFHVIHTPGHTEGSVAYTLATEGKLVCFTGDALFAGSVGRTDLPGGDTTTLMISLASLIDVLPKETVILPGHGQGSTMAAELATNPYLTK